MRKGLAGMVRFEPRRFRSTVPYYARYRVPYPDRLIEFVARHCGLERGDRVLDLGCGPRPLAVAFARLGAAVTAMDPEPEMLAAAKERAQETGVTLTLLEGSSYDLGPALGRFRLVTMGRSFHWMDRDATLTTLDGLIEPGGAVVLFGDRRVKGAGADWRSLLDRLRREFSPAQAAERHRRRREQEPHEVVLLRSVFSRLERHGVISRQILSPDEIIGRVYSLSDTSPEALGDRRQAFEKKLRAGLARLARKHELSEILEVTALIARRSQESP
jgi:SAM-dependent methyltransferase